MNREVHYEGWLIKSPPTKRIWRARWRRRWFTLKQGEIPEQFCLEYYTDRNCRKLKGVIDLDQCEQVDCGLRLENRKQKFQFMFDIKTPKRTYYLAADTEADMRDWVNCICQVCHLHDTKQSNDMQMDRTQNTASTALTNSTNNTTTTSLNSSASTPAGGEQHPTSMQRQSFSNDILRRTTSMTAAASAAPAASVIDQQPKRKNDDSAAAPYQNNNSDGTYVNTDYTNRDTVIFQGHFERHQLGVAAATAAADEVASQTDISSPQPSSAAVYLNSPVFPQTPSDSGRLVVSANGVVRKIPESLVLNTTPLPDTHSNSVQASPALSASSGPYIPISECFSGSPKFIMDSNNPTTPLNNLDPKFYDTPRCHNNIGLNLTNDQSYSPKITNCSVPQIATTTKNRSDSDSESVFTDDDEWTHPLPLRENVDRSTRPSDSSVENESFVLTYTQRFSKMTEDNGKGGAGGLEAGKSGGVAAKENSLEKLAKVLKNKNNLILDFIENGKLHRDMPQLSDTENTSPAIGPLDSTSVVEESYDIPRSQNLPYYNMAHLFEKMHSPQTTNPIASSTPNLMVGSATGGGGLAMGGGPTAGGSTEPTALSPPATVRTLPRQHCYTNAAPSKVEGNVFRYDFIEQSNLPPVNRKLKPKVQNVEDKPPEEIAAKPPIGSKGLAAHSHEQLDSPKVLDYLTHKFMESTMQSIPDPVSGGGAVGGGENCSPIKPPSVDRKLKPNAYKFASPGASMTMSPSSRRSTCAPLSMAGAVPNERDNYVRKTRTLPRHPPPPIYANEGDSGSSTPIMTVQHQRTASAAAALQFSQFMPSLQQHMMQQPAPAKAGNEHTLQYFDLDVANPPTINRQSMIVSNLYGAEPSTRGPSVVYIPVDFVKTEAFKRIREERKKESEGVSDGAAASSASATNK